MDSGSLDFGFVPRSLVIELKDKDWEIRSDAVERLYILVNDIQDTGAVLQHVPTFLRFLSKLLFDSNFTISLTTIRLIGEFVGKINQAIKPCLPLFLPNLIEKFGDSKVIIRQETLRIVIRLMNILTPTPIIVLLLLSYESKHWNIKLQLIHVIIIALVAYKGHPFDYALIVPTLCSALRDEKPKLKQSAVEALAVINTQIGLAQLDMLLSQSRLEDSWKLSVARRITRGNLPFIAADGCLEFRDPSPEFGTNSPAITHRDIETPSSSHTPTPLSSSIYSRDSIRESHTEEDSSSRQQPRYWSAGAKITSRNKLPPWFPVTPSHGSGTSTPTFSPISTPLNNYSNYSSGGINYSNSNNTGYNMNNMNNNNMNNTNNNFNNPPSSPVVVSLIDDLMTPSPGRGRSSSFTERIVYAPLPPLNPIPHQNELSTSTVLPSVNSFPTTHGRATHSHPTLHTTSNSYSEKYSSNLTQRLNQLNSSQSSTSSEMVPVTKTLSSGDLSKIRAPPSNATMRPPRPPTPEKSLGMGMFKSEEKLSQVLNPKEEEFDFNDATSNNARESLVSLPPRLASLSNTPPSATFPPPTHKRKEKETEIKKTSPPRGSSVTTWPTDPLRRRMSTTLANNDNNNNNNNNNNYNTNNSKSTPSTTFSNIISPRFSVIPITQTSTTLTSSDSNDNDNNDTDNSKNDNNTPTLHSSSPISTTQTPLQKTNSSRSLSNSPINSFLSDHTSSYNQVTSPTTRSPVNSSNFFPNVLNKSNDSVNNNPIETSNENSPLNEFRALKISSVPIVPELDNDTNENTNNTNTIRSPLSSRRRELLLSENEININNNNINTNSNNSNMNYSNNIINDSLNNLNNINNTNNNTNNNNNVNTESEVRVSETVDLNLKRRNSTGGVGVTVPQSVDNSNGGMSDPEENIYNENEASNPPRRNSIFNLSSDTPANRNTVFYQQETKQESLVSNINISQPSTSTPFYPKRPPSPITLPPPHHFNSNYSTNSANNITTIPNDNIRNTPVTPTFNSDANTYHPKSNVTRVDSNTNNNSKNYTIRNVQPINTFNDNNDNSNAFGNTVTISSNNNNNSNSNNNNNSNNISNTKPTPISNVMSMGSRRSSLSPSPVTTAPESPPLGNRTASAMSASRLKTSSDLPPLLSPVGTPSHSKRDSQASLGRRTSGLLSAQTLSPLSTSNPNSFAPSPSTLSVPGTVNLSPSDILPSESLPPLENPEFEFRNAMEWFEKGEWYHHFEAINVLRRLAIHHYRLLINQMHATVLAVLTQVNNLRSLVSRNALICLGDLFKYCGRAVEPHLDETVLKVIKKYGESSGFIEVELDRAMALMMQYMSEGRVLTVLMLNTNHKNGTVRTKIACLIADLIEQMGPKIWESSHIERVIPVVVGFIQEASVDARAHGRRGLGALDNSNALELEKVIRRTCSDAIQRKVVEVLEKIRKGGDPSLYAVSGGSAKRARPSKFSPKPTRSSELVAVEKQDVVSPPRRFSANNIPLNEKLESYESVSYIAPPMLPASAGSRSTKETPTKDPPEFELLPQILLEMESSEWRNRYQAIEQIYDIIMKFPTRISSKLVKIFDSFVPRLNDGNSKVNLCALVVLCQIIPVLKDNLECILSLAIPPLANNVAATKMEIRQATLEVLDSMVQNITHSILVQPFAQAITNGNIKVKVVMLLKLADLIEPAYSQKPQIISKYCLPVALKLLDEKKGELRNSIARVFQSMHTTMGDAFWENSSIVSLSKPDQQKLVDLLT